MDGPPAAKAAAGTLAIAAAILLWLLAAAALLALSKAAAWAWRKLGAIGQLAAGIVACMLGGRALGDIQVVPEASIWTGVAGAMLAAGYTYAWKRQWDQRRSEQQREWVATAGRGAVVSGGGDFTARYRAESAPGYERLAAVEREIAAITTRICEQGELADVLLGLLAEFGTDPVTPDSPSRKRNGMRLVSGSGDAG